VWLSCTQRCGGQLFRALFAEVEVNASGEYQDHRVTQPSYVCLNCGAPAVDLGEVGATMASDEEDDVAVMAMDLLCPHCETTISVFPGESCPNCGAELELGEVR
jgi:rubrerythrin